MSCQALAHEFEIGGEITRMGIRPFVAGMIATVLQALIYVGKKSSIKLAGGEPLRIDLDQLRHFPLVFGQCACQP